MAAGRPILIIEDDNAVRLLLAEQIAATGVFHPTATGTLDEATRLLAEPDARFDAIILDIGLPDGDGRDFCAETRRHGHTMPIILLTGATDENDIVSGLNSGASDYVIKPFRANELLARLQAQLRSFDTSEAATFTIGPHTVQPVAKLLIRADTKQRISLTSKEVEILRFFYRRPDCVVPRQVLMDEVWGYHAAAESHTAETHIYRLRQKMDDTHHRLLVTEPGGYRFDRAPSELTQRQHDAPPRLS